MQTYENRFVTVVPASLQRDSFSGKQINLRDSDVPLSRYSLVAKVPAFGLESNFRPPTDLDFKAVRDDLYLVCTSQVGQPSRLISVED